MIPASGPTEKTELTYNAVLFSKIYLLLSRFPEADLNLERALQNSDESTLKFRLYKSNF